MPITIATVNVQGTRGSKYSGFTALRKLGMQCDFVGLLEHVELDAEDDIPKNAIEGVSLGMADCVSSDKIEKFFFPLYSSQASPARRKWDRLPRRAGVAKQKIASASVGLGVVTRLSIQPLFGQACFPGERHQPIVGYYSVGNVDESTLLYFGDRDTERRGAVFCRVHFDGQPLMIVVTHLATLMGERSTPVNVDAELRGRKLRESQCKELIHGINRLREESSYHGGECEYVIMGDFNCEPNAPELYHLRDSGWSCAFDLTVPEFLTKKHSSLCLDHVWTTAGLKVTKAQTKAIGGADHFAVIADIVRYQ